MHFVKHVIVGRDDVKEILDDAHIIIDSSLVRRNSNPRTSHASHIIWNNLVDFVPNTSVMTTSVASKRKHRKPRLKHWSMKAETLGDLLFESFIFQVPVVHIHAGGKGSVYVLLKCSIKSSVERSYSFDNIAILLTKMD